MKKNRRTFLKTTMVGGITSLSTSSVLSNSVPNIQANQQSFLSKPWLEISKAAYWHNAAQISKMANGRPILAILKNNAYGIGAVEVAKILDESKFIWGIAIVKDSQAIAIRDAGVSKPILLMGDFEATLSKELLVKDITLSVYSKASSEKIKQFAAETNKTAKVALYIDTGLGRMGIPHQEVSDLASEVAKRSNLQITQTFSTLTTPHDFAQEQVQRFKTILQALKQKGISSGVTHLSPSFSMLDLPEDGQDLVRPGILLHGSFPLAKMSFAAQYPLQVPFKLKAPIIRLEKLKAGDTIGFSRFYKVEQDEWIATLPIGWADGYYSGAENGAKVLLGNQLYPVVNVNASHANISLGAATKVKIGDIATLIGPDVPAITPEGFGELAKGHNYLQINYKESIPKQVYETF